MKLFFGILLLINTGCSSLTAMKHSSEELIGIWVINHASSKVDYSVIEYLPSGDKCEVEYSMSLNSSVDIKLYWNKWSFDGKIIHTVMHATTGSIPIGYKINDRVLKLTDDKLDVVINDPGEWGTEYHQKLLRPATGQVCDLVMASFHNQKALNK
ncbi:MAG TPA: hypothetical protein VIZ65_08455 [Cellvibrionaceae bacterium]